MTRRCFGEALLWGLGASALVRPQSSAPRRLKAGHTGITWGNNTAQAISDCGRLGFHGFETFGQVLASWEAKGGIGTLLEENHLPLVSAYCTYNMTDSMKQKDE